MKRASNPAILLLFVAALAAAAWGDIKITTRTTAMGRSSQSTVYIKGARQRTESGESVTLMQCDKHRMVSLDLRRKTFTVIPLGEVAAPAAAAQAAVAAQAAGGAPRRGGVVTVTSANRDTGERQKMFGYEARHIQSTMIMESSPNACYPMNMKMESDGWYADLSPRLMCASSPMMGGAMGAGMRPDCLDQHRFHSSGVTRLGYPLKLTTTMAMPGGMNMTTSTEVTDLSNATLPDSLFEIPPDFHQVGMYSAETVGTAGPEESAPAEAPAPPAAPAPSAAPAAPALPAKAAGVVRVGVVGLKDLTTQSLPTDNLRVLLIGEIRNRQVDAVPLDATERQAIEEEARSKDCDYILFTDLGQLDQGPEAKLPMQFHTIPVTGEGDYLGRVDWQLFRTSKTVPQWKTSEASRASGLGVNAVGDSVIKEAGAVVEEIQHPHKTEPAPAKRPARRRPK